MRDDGAFDRNDGIDMKVARGAIEAGRGRMEEFVGAHHEKIGAGGAAKSLLNGAAFWRISPRPVEPGCRDRPSMNFLTFASGDLAADRRADYAEMLAAAGDATAAAEVLRGALELAPGWAAGWFRLGELCEAAGDANGAAGAWRQALRLDPSDRTGASLKLALMGEATHIDAAPSAFVEALFDQYAPNFDRHLVERLGYRVPEIIMRSLLTVGSPRFAHVVDLGCGTGLMAERLKPLSSFLEGHDISAAMLRKARAKGLYDRLYRTDLQLLEAGDAPVDLVVAADVLIYVGRLERLFATVARMLAPGGHFAFSVETHDGPDDMALRPSRRYAHSPAYVADALRSAGLVERTMERAVIRHDRNAAVDGLVVVAGRPRGEESPRMEATSLPANLAAPEHP
jgi:predicted TPR repeat methyltransferase